MGAAEASADIRHALAVLLRGAHAIPVALDEAALERFAAYMETLLLWRARLSLTGASTALAIVRSHILDSLHVAPYVRPGFRVADVGSGAGFPGMPLAIACPESTFFLIEARRKRANFLREVVRQARLANVEVVETRLDAPDCGMAMTFDLVVARAIGPVGAFLALSASLLKASGLAVAMQGPSGWQGAGRQFAGFGSAEVVSYVLAGGIRRLLLVYIRR